ncbi:MAG: nitroreductase family protein [Syntrophales bacterium]
MTSIIKTIKMRRSCRTYEIRAIEQDKRIACEAFLTGNTTCPFGSKVRFTLSDMHQIKLEEMNVPGTYGVIQGAQFFIIGAVGKSEMAMEDFGYAMERNVLCATESGLGTCWLGGTFKRTGFARIIDLQKDELLPAVTPVGYPKQKKSLTDRIFRYVASSDKRKPWEQIFFLNNLETPLKGDQAGDFGQVLECLRIGPSASNRQPWRIIKEENSMKFHFYLKRTPGYGNLIGGISLQNIDMGIAMCHFELSAREMGLNGQWVRRIFPGAKAAPGGIEYIVSWVGA